MHAEPWLASQPTGEGKGEREREKKNLNTEQAPCFGLQEYHIIASILFTYDT